MRTRIFAAMLLLLLGPATGTVLGQGKQCMFANEFFSPGDVSCQAGKQFRCVAGSWQAVGTECSDDAADADEEGLEVDPGVRSPKVKEPPVKEPAVKGQTAPTIPQP